MVWILGWFCGNISFFYWFQGRNLLMDKQILKGVGVSKRGRIKYQGGVCFFLFINQNLCHILLLLLITPVSANTTLKERCLG